MLTKITPDNLQAAQSSVQSRRICPEPCKFEQFIHTVVLRKLKCCLLCSRHAESRRRKRKEEVKEDAADREAEDVERAAARQKREEEAQLAAEGMQLTRTADLHMTFWV